VVKFHIVSYQIKRGPELIRKAAIFLFSLAFHAVLIHFVLHAKIQIKIYPTKRVVRNVILAAPEKAFLPEDIGKYLENLQGLTSKTGSEYAGQPVRIQAEPGEGRSNVPGSEAEIGQPPSPGGAKNAKEAGQVEFYPGLASKFELDQSSKYKSELPQGYSLNLPSRLGKMKGVPGEKKEGYIKDINRLKYPYSAFSATGRPSGTASIGPYELRRGIRGARATFKVQGYNIAPWAEKVLNKVLLNWIIPFEQIKNVQGVVRISAVIERGGELSSVQVVSTSMVQVLDETALKALRMSAPFPQFPDDFPNRNIEAYFEFQYND
jgi:TonB family protein